MEYWKNGIMANAKELRIDEFGDCKLRKLLNSLVS